MKQDRDGRAAAGTFHAERISKTATIQVNESIDEVFGA